MKEIRCPGCGQSDARKVSVLYEQGTVSNKVDPIVGLGMGHGGLSVGVAAGIGWQGQSALAARLAPPTVNADGAKTWGFLVFGVMAVIAVAILSAGTTDEPKVLGGLLLVVSPIAGLLAYSIGLRNAAPAHRAALARWNRLWCCMRCGEVFDPTGLTAPRESLTDEQRVADLGAKVEMRQRGVGHQGGNGPMRKTTLVLAIILAGLLSLVAYSVLRGKAPEPEKAAAPEPEKAAAPAPEKPAAVAATPEPEKAAVAPPAPAPENAASATDWPFGKTFAEYLEILGHDFLYSPAVVCESPRARAGDPIAKLGNLTGSHFYRDNPQTDVYNFLNNQMGWGFFLWIEGGRGWVMAGQIDNKMGNSINSPWQKVIETTQRPLAGEGVCEIYRRIIITGGKATAAKPVAPEPEKAAAPAPEKAPAPAPAPEKVAAPAPTTKPAEAPEKARLVGFMSYQKSGRPYSVPVRWSRWFSTMELCSATNNGEIQDLTDKLANASIPLRVTRDTSSATSFSLHWIDESGIEIERRSHCEPS